MCMLDYVTVRTVNYLFNWVLLGHTCVHDYINEILFEIHHSILVVTADPSKCIR